MDLTLNGAPYAPTPGQTVRDLVAAHTGRDLDAHGRPTDGERLGVAVALDDAVVPRSTWATTPVPATGRLEVVTAVQGG